MDIQYIIMIILVHYVADFVTQTEWEASNKSKNIWALLLHTSSYTGLWMLILWNYGMVLGEFGISAHFDMDGMLAFGAVTFFTHTITDYFTSRWSVSKLPADRIAGNYRAFWNVYGFDQVLHYVQLIFTFTYFLQ